MNDIEAIRRRLPHRYPFLLVDRILMHDDRRVVSLKNVTANEPFFQGHFPDEAVMPGVLILEAMAQTTAFLCMDADASTPSTASTPLTGYLIGVDRAKFRRKVVPGDQLRIEAEAVRFRHGILQADVRATVDEELACSAVLTVALADESEA